MLVLIKLCASVDVGVTLPWPLSRGESVRVGEGRGKITCTVVCLNLLTYTVVKPFVRFAAPNLIELR
jgi:hypothetical protein